MRHVTPGAPLVLLAVSFACLVGCASHHAEEPDGFYSESREYKKAYDATYQVLARHFRVTTSRHTSNGQDIVAVSRVSTDGISQYRFKVTARVVWDDDDILVPDIRVQKQVDMSVADAHVRSVAQQNHRWRTVGFQRDMETRLLNEVHDALHGGGFDSDPFFLDPMSRPRADGPRMDAAAMTVEPTGAPDPQ